MTSWGSALASDPHTTLQLSLAQQKRQDGTPTNFPPVAHVPSLLFN